VEVPLIFGVDQQENLRITTEKSDSPSRSDVKTNEMAQFDLENYVVVDASLLPVLVLEIPFFLQIS